MSNGCAKLILGTVQFGLNYGIANREGKPDLDKVKGILHQAADVGITLLDTAAAYGDSETVLGSVLSKDAALQKRFRIVSKVMPMPQGLTQEAGEKFILDSVTNSLKNLQVEQLFGVLFHREADARFLPFLKSLQKKGLLQYAGFSADGALPDETPQADVIQVPGNVFDRRFVPFPQTKPRYLFVRSVYLQGLLLMPDARIPGELRPLAECRRKLEKLAADCEIAPAELYMRYLLSIPEIDAVLTGVDNKEQLAFNANLAAKGALDAETLAKIRTIVPDFSEDLIRPSKWPKNK